MNLIQGDCLAELKRLKPESVHALVTDPPAGISFMGKEWDTDKGGRKEWISWMTSVMAECLRVMKPGAHGLIWAIPRTSHWTATALEDAGFEVRDVVTHLFGSGFPKSLDVSKAIDKAAGAERMILGKDPNQAGRKKNTGIVAGQAQYDSLDERVAYLTAPATEAAKQWQGFGTALKPASEHWILVRKPCSEKTVAANVSKHGTGALNIDASRIEAQDADKLEKNWTQRKAPAGFSEKEGTCYGVGTTDDFSYRKAQGRFPANLVLSHSLDCEENQCALDCAVKGLDEQSGNLGKSAGGNSKNVSNKVYGQYSDSADKKPCGFGDSGGASRFFYCAKISTSERNAGCEGMPKKQGGGMTGSANKSLKTGSGNERDCTAQNHHPTVKPKKLMAYLIRMVTPPGGTVLDPFMGSGSTGIAAIEGGFRFVGIEREAEYTQIAEKRIYHAMPEFRKQMV